MKAYEDQQAREEKARANFKHVKKAESLKCPECGMDLMPVKKPGGIKWHCLGIADGCYYDRWEASE